MAKQSLDDLLNNFTETKKLWFPLKLDPVKEEFVNDAEANSMRGRAERDWRA